MGQALEEKIQSAWEASEYQRAATMSIQSYGPEILGFLVAFTKDRSHADDVFSYFLEDFWRGLPKFEWRCTLRAWAYTLARHAARRFSSRSLGRRRRHIPLSEVPELAKAAEEVRTSTAHYLRTAARSRMRELRKELSEQDQILLVLRIDRDLSWREIAIIVTDDHDAVDRDDLDRTITGLRKQFERAKGRLKRLAAAEGLVGSN
jgi:RNA polymerase sigma-70 factor (ECF subfamily)